MEHRSEQFYRSNNDHLFRGTPLRTIVVPKLSGFWKTDRAGNTDAQCSELDATWNFNVPLWLLSSPALLDERFR